jgi:tetrahydromethanopterin S-methyltransferase subunit G
MSEPLVEQKLEQKLEQTIDIVNSYNRELLNDLDEVKQLQKIHKMDVTVIHQHLDQINEKVEVALAKKTMSAKVKIAGLIIYAVVMPLLIMSLKISVETL